MSPDPARPDAGGGATGRTTRDEPTLLSRMLEDVVRVLQLELRLLEAEIARTLSLTVDRTIAALVLLYASAITGSCLVVALAFLLHTWLAWWLCFALSGTAALICGLVAYAIMTKTSSSE